MKTQIGSEECPLTGITITTIITVTSTTEQNTNMNQIYRKANKLTTRRKPLMVLN
jgi:hypothetical protein